MRYVYCFALLFGIVAALPCRDAEAEDYPSRPVKIIVGFPAGTSTDIIARIYADKLSEQFGQRFFVENLVGAAGNLSATTAARAAADGHTLYLCTFANAVSVGIYKNLQYQFPGDFAPIAPFASGPAILMVTRSLGVRSVQDLIRAAKERPGQIQYGSQGVGTGGHMTAELFNMMAGVKLAHVPYKGNNQAILDVLSGRIAVSFAAIGTVAGFLKDERVQVLGVSSAKRSSLAPDIPTVAESGLPGFEVTIWYGLAAPKGTPAPVINALAEAVARAAGSEDVKTRLAASGAEPLSASPARFGVFIQEEVDRWAKVVDFSGTRID